MIWHGEHHEVTVTVEGGSGTRARIRCLLPAYYECGGDPAAWPACRVPWADRDEREDGPALDVCNFVEWFDACGIDHGESAEDEFDIPASPHPVEVAWDGDSYLWRLRVSS